MRKIGLDILRCIAVVLVLFRHSELGDSNIFKHFGWLGVDLFFVLSGFLISNLLFTEYKKTGGVNLGSFLIRRGFKIFPPFYFFLVVTLLLPSAITEITEIETSKLISEIFYLQSYLPRIWNHTWTLAVEEHFYLVFSVLVFILTKRRLLEKKGMIVLGLIILLGLSFFLRYQISYPHRDGYSSFMQTHLRSDGIILGVLMSYLQNFYDLSFVKKRIVKLALLSLSILLIAPAFYHIGGSFFMNTVGISITNIGFAIIVLISIDLDEYIQSPKFKPLKPLFWIISFIGINSYSIYLWHLNAKGISEYFFSPDNAIPMYFVISIVLGIAMSYLIEKPALRIRQYLFSK